MDGVVAVVPSLDPDEKLLQVVEGLRGVGISKIVIVNDGSGAGSLRFFPNVVVDGITLLAHDKNLGKGRALKTAFGYILREGDGCGAVITVDCDGQHSASDTARVAAKCLETGLVVFGARDFDLPQVPQRSRLGNKFTRGAFRLFFGIRVSDTQTGLRAFPVGMLPQLTQIEGERFEYETNVLLELSKDKTVILEEPIETCYSGSNEASHYRTFRDSMRIFSVAAKFMRFSLSSLAAALIDNVAFFAFLRVFSESLGIYAVTAAFAAARLLSSAFNFLCNHLVVFKSGSRIYKAIGRYYLLAAGLFLIGNAILNPIVLAFDLTAGYATAIKVAVDTVLFIASFHIQRKWVFGK